MKLPSFKSFAICNTKNYDCLTPNAAFYRKYGNVTLEEAYEVYLKGLSGFIEAKEKIDQLETFLLKKGIVPQQSSKSESRYYKYKGMKLRFGSHVYPTGSMTDLDMGVIDLVADPDLINKITFDDEN